MNPSDQIPRSVRLHLTNVAGAGATQLLLSLLPALEASGAADVDEIYLPDRGVLSHYLSANSRTRVEVYKRYLPNALSRLLECTLLGYRFNSPVPILVLGDLPLWCRAPQTVFVQTSHLLKPDDRRLKLGALKYWISRFVFRRNLPYVRALVVQTDVMRDALIATYPAVKGRVHVIAQPVPSWLLQESLKCQPRTLSAGGKLNLIYPAAGYPHKNHKLLEQIPSSAYGSWPISRLTLTLDESMNPAPQIPWIHCSGFLDSDRMIDSYKQADGLLFLSRDESYGFPLVEAMFIGLPIICPNLAYARTLCGEQAIYFDPLDVMSLKSAVLELQARLASGWWPDWKEQLKKIPSDWDVVAEMMLSIVFRS